MENHGNNYQSLTLRFPEKISAITETRLNEYIQDNEICGTGFNIFRQDRMSFLFVVGCFLLSFSPILVIFWRLIAIDPIRTILFCVGAFIWLISLQISAFTWYILCTSRNLLPLFCMLSIVLQEIARISYFVLLRYMHRWLICLSPSGVDFSSAESFNCVRHILAVVCGAGMGITPVLFLVVNVIVDFSDHGEIGLPATVPNVSEQLSIEFGKEIHFFPITYLLCACMLSLFHIFWTVIAWDGYYERKLGKRWTKIFFVVFSHSVVSALSFWNQNGYQVFVLCGLLLLLLTNAWYSFHLMGYNWSSLSIRIHDAFRIISRRNL